MISQAINEFGINVLSAITAEKNGNHIISPLSLSSALGMVHLGAKGDTNNELRQVLCYDKYNITDSEAHNAYKYLLQQIRGANTRENVSTALGMVHLGANSETNNTADDEHNHCKFFLEQINSSQCELNVANRVVAQNDFDILDDYSNQLQINYYASIQYADFANDGHYAIKIINKWVADKTSNKIRLLFDKPLPKDTKLVIVNAIYFKGEWIYKFDSKQTREHTFNNNGITKVNAQMMFMANTDYKFTASEQLDADILEMPYRYTGGHISISMYIVLPHTVNGLQKTASALTEKKLSSAIESMKIFPIDLFLPKFKMEVSYTLVDQLRSVGLNNIFTDNADLSGINGHRNLLVSDVVHKVFIDVNEKGSEAAAATGVVMYAYGGSSFKPPLREFKVDHPFIFVIRDKTNHVNLFYGQISQL